VTPKIRVLLLPVLALGVAVLISSIVYICVSRAKDGRERFGDKHEWSILQSLEAKQQDTPISGLEFSQFEEYYIVSLPAAGESKRIWIMLNPQNPPFYKPLPQANYSLSREQYDRIIATRHATSTVEEVLASLFREAMQCI
jgi:hypothetical protein